jgi:photosystem II stability/assembly factor-like uncharacterized protein
MDGGKSWSPIGGGLPSTYPSRLVSDPLSPTTLYAGTKRNGLFKSTNGGKSWSPINSGLPRAQVEVFSLAIDPGIESTLYAGTSGGLFMSVNGGEGWTPVKSEPNTQVVNTLAVDPTSHRTLYAGLKDGVFKSTDGGETWSAGKLGPQYLLTLAIDPTNARILYAGTYLSGLFQSTDGGEKWRAINTGLPEPGKQNTALAFAIDPTDSNTVYVATSSGVFKSTNGGERWVAFNAGLTNSFVKALVIDSTVPKRIYAGTQGGGVFVLHEPVSSGD